MVEREPAEEVPLADPDDATSEADGVALADGRTEPSVFRTVAEHSVDPLLFVSDGVVRWIAPSIQTALGWTPAELEDLPLSGLCHVEDRDGFESLLQQVMDSGTHRGVFRLRAKNDEFLWVLVSLSRELDDLDGPAVVGSLREINLRVEAERERGELLERYRTIAEHLPDVLVWGSEDGLLKWVSDSVTGLLGWRPDEVAGRPFVDFVHEDQRAEVAVVQEGLRHGVASEFEARLRTPSGEWRWVDIHVKPIVDEHGAVVGDVAGWRDAEGERRLREELRARDEQSRASADGLLDPHVLVEAVRDDGGRIVDFTYIDVNSATCESLSLTREQLLGSSLLASLPGLMESGLLERYQAVVGSGQPLALDDALLENSDTGQVRRYDIRASRVGDGLSLTWRDVTERFESVQRVANSEEMYRLLAENSSDAIVHTRGDHIVWASSAIADALAGPRTDWTSLRLTELRLTDVVHPEDLAVYAEMIAEVSHGSMVVRRLRVRLDDSRYHWVEIHAKQYIDAHGVNDGQLSLIRIVDTEVAADVKLDRLARFDNVTGLLNRNEALRRLGAASTLRRHPGSELAVLFCDVDNFKTINDTYGHAAGDAVLRRLARRITECARHDDVVARFGGDEFLVLLSGIHDLDEAFTLAEKIRAAFAAPITLDDRDVFITLSIGLTLAAAGENADVLIARADNAMFRAKSAGRNRVIAIAPADARPQPAVT